MLDGNNCSHSVSDISSCEIRVFVFEDTDLTGIIVHHRGKRCFKSGQMRSALGIVNIVTETKNILAEITGILKSHFYLDTICLAFQINRLMQCLRIAVQITDVSDDSLWFMVFQFLRLCCTQILKINRQFRIKVCGFMKAAFDLCRRKTGFFKNLRIRKKINAGSCRFRSSQFRKKSLLQLNSRDSSLIMIMMYISVSADADIQIRRKCIDNRRTHTMKSSTGLVCGIVKLTACMQRRKHQSLRRHSLLMHVYRDSSSVICHCSGTILLQCHMDLTAVSGKMLIHCIVYDLIDQMIQSLTGRTSNIHTRSFPDCLQPFQNRDTASIIGLLFCHGYIHFLSYTPVGVCYSNICSISYLIRFQFSRQSFDRILGIQVEQSISLEKKIIREISDYLKQPVRESNPCFRRERATS